MDPGRENLPPSPNTSEDRARVTAKTVEQARQERENAYISLMDRMEESVGGKGQYFVKFGHKKDSSRGRYSDTRALLLIKSAVDPKGDSNIFIVITREGAKGLRLVPQDKNPQDQDEQGEALMRHIIQEKLSLEHLSDPKEYFYDIEGGLQDNGDILIGSNNPLDMLHFPNNGRFSTRYTEVRPVDNDTVKTAIEESQKAAEIPHYLRLQEEQKKITDAINLSDVIKQLPPKQ